MNILITGGCGFIGSNFINYILKKDNNTIKEMCNKILNKLADYNRDKLKAKTIIIRNNIKI